MLGLERCDGLLGTQEETPWLFQWLMGRKVPSAAVDVKTNVSCSIYQHVKMNGSAFNSDQFLFIYHQLTSLAITPQLCPEH